MDFLDSYHLWADAHAFFDDPFPGKTSTTNPLAAQSAAWWERLTHHAPNGALMRHNAMFDALSGDGSLYLMHITHALEQISEHGVIYPSGGCLVGSVYCTPLTLTENGYRMHNLGEYVLTKEAPAFVSKLGGAAGTPTPLIVEVTVPRAAYRGLAGIDYLRLGEIHLQIFLQLEYLLSKAERHQLRETIVGRIKNSAAFLDLAGAIAYEGVHVAAETFLTALDQAIRRLPILGYMYFEALAEYLMLHSTSERSRALADLGELNNWLYKEMLFAAFPGMAGKFDLTKFRPSPRDLERLLHQVDPTIDLKHAKDHLLERLAFLISARLLTPGKQPGDWHHIRWEFEDLRRLVAPLLGHLIHRELRTYGRYPDFYFYYDQYKALQAWNYWNHMDIIAPFNGTIPKGEIGINPAYPDLDYTIHCAEVTGPGFLAPAERLQIAIAPRLVDIKYTLMRNNQWTPRAADTARGQASARPGRR